MASAVDGVCSCGGGGVIASLMYDVRVEYDVVVVCTKITIVKEKHYLKIISLMNHI